MWQRLGLVIICAALLLAVLDTRVFSGTAEQGRLPNWTNPGAQTLRLVGPAPDVPEQPDFQANLDCDEMTYRLTTGGTMQAGCFMPTAYGWVDPDQDTVIFDGTDEAVPLKPYTTHQIITPWPGTVDALAMTPAITNGTYLALYKNVLGKLADERNLAGQLVAKQITGPPDIQLTDPGGRALIINPQTVTFSDGGSWLVVEDLQGSFVRLNLATLDMLPFAPAFGMSGNPALLKSQVAISKNGRYVAIENATAASFTVYDLAGCQGSGAALQPLNCPAHDYQPFIAAQLPGRNTIAHVRFINENLLSFSVSIGDKVDSYELAPADSITALTDYLALGDSYTSGEGAFDYLLGTDTGDDVCHLSVHSYPLTITHQLFDSGHSVACSGARMQDILPTQPNNYRGQVAGGVPRSTRPDDAVDRILADYTPGYVAQAEFVSHYLPGVMTVSVGGDDIGFGDMVQNCVEPHISLHLSDGTCYDTYEDRIELKNLIDRTVPKWTVLYRNLRNKSPGTRLYVVGYPQIAVDTGDCALNVHLSKSELEFSEEVVDYLNSAIKRAATDAGVNYIDISRALGGHRLCEAANYDVAVNGLTAGTDGGPLVFKIFGKESYHPNALGQALIANAILKQSHNLQNPTPAATAGGADDQTNLLNAPRSGRPINTLIPESSLINRVINRGQTATIHLDGASDGLRPGATYTVHLGGPASTPLTAITAGTDSGLNGTVDIPGTTTAGGHTVDITGTDQGGQPIDITQPIYVAATPTDADGDGVPDTSDRCPGAFNSGTDADHDDIDDSCDDSIATTSASGQSSPAEPEAMPPTTSTGTPPASSVLQPTTIVETGQTVSRTIGLPAGTIIATLGSRLAGYRVDLTDPVRTPTSREAGRVLLAAIAKDQTLGQPVATQSGAASHCVSHLLVINSLTILLWAGFIIVLPVMLLYGKLSWSCTMMIMIWLRKGIVHLLSLALLSALIAGALAVSIDVAFSKPDKLETWLSQSNFYSGFIDNAIQQAEKSADSGSTPAGGLSLNDTTVQQAAKSTFSPALVQQYVNTFLNSNYAWLEGKTATPNFSIDLTSAKESLAQKVGQAAQDHVTSLPTCSIAQALSQQTDDPLALTCRPAQLSPAAASSLVTQQLEQGSGFLSNPVITPTTINPNGDNGQPYYKALSYAPTVYRAATDLPWVLGAVAVLSIVGIVFIAPTKRRGTRRVGIVLLEAGILLVVTKVLADFAFKKVETKLFNSASVGPLQQALTDFTHRIETQLVSTELYIGIGFIVLAVLVIAALIFTRNRTLPARRSDLPVATPDSNPPVTPAAPDQSKPTQQRTKRSPRLIQ